MISMTPAQKMRQLLLLTALLAVVAQAQKLWFVQPQDHDVLHSDIVTVELATENFQVPRDGHVDLYIADQFAGRLTSLGTQFSVRALSNGWYSLEAVMIDNSGVAVRGKDAIIYIEVDVIDEAEVNSQACMTSILPSITGLVTVVIGSRNRWESLERTVQSVKNQTYKQVEIVVVDDGSTQEEYGTKLNSPAMTGVTFLRMGTNIGMPGIVRNLGIQVARGEWVAFVDDDDVWMPTKLEMQVTAMRRHSVNMSSTDALVGHGPFGIARYISEENSGHLTSEGRPPEAHGPPNPEVDWPPYGYPRWLADLASAATVRQCVGEDVLPELWNRSLIVRNNFHVCSSVIVNRDLLIRCGGFGTATFAEDYMLWKRVMRHTDSIFIREPLTYYQLASDGLAAKWLKMKLGEQPTAAGGTAEEEAKTTDPQKNVAAHEGPKKEEGAEEEEEEMHPEGDQRTEL